METVASKLDASTRDWDFCTTQDWAGYAAADHGIWKLLYERRIRELERDGSEVFLRGAEAIGLRADQVPDLQEVNARLAERIFPTTVSIRSMEQLDYLPEPDIFHDVFGHAA